MSCLRGIWTSLTVIFALTCSMAFVSPVWYENTDTKHIKFNVTSVSFGLLSECRRATFLNQTYFILGECHMYKGFLRIPSLYWQVTAALYGSGCGLLWLTAFLALTSCCFKKACGRPLAALTGMLQILAVILSSLGLLCYPGGLESPYVEDLCGKSAGFFNPGHCQLAWGFVLAILGTALAMFCPILALLIDDRPRKSEFVTMV